MALNITDMCIKERTKRKQTVVIDTLNDNLDMTWYSTRKLSNIFDR